MTILTAVRRFKPGTINRRLWLLIGLGTAALLTELGLRAWEQQQKLDRELQTLRGRIQLLQASADRVDWASLSKELSQLQQDLQDQLWQAPSEAQAQAMLRDWLSSMLKTAGIQRPTLRLQPPQAAIAAPGSKPGGETPSPAPAETAGASRQLLQQATRVRAQISFELQPGTLEAVLQQVERGGQLASVDSLTVSKRTRRVEMAISMPVIIKPAPEEKAR